MRPELDQLFLLCAFVSILPYPRTRLFLEVFVKVVGTAIGLLIILGEILRPVASFLKVDMQSKSVSGVIYLSTFAPRIGERVLKRDLGVARLREKFGKDVGGEMQDFRRDLRKQFVFNAKLEELPSSKDLLNDIQQSHARIRRRHAIGEVIIGLLIAAVSIAVSSISIGWGAATLVGLYGLVFPVSMSLRSLVVDTVAYDADSVVMDDKFPSAPNPTILMFMKYWNEMLIRNEAIIHKLLFVSFTKGEFPIGYERGEQLMEEVLAGEKEMDEALDDMIQEELGEETTGSRLIRGLIKRYVGI